MDEMLRLPLWVPVDDSDVCDRLSAHLRCAAPFLLLLAVSLPAAVLMQEASIMLMVLGFMLGYEVSEFAWAVAVLWVLGWVVIT